MARYHNSDWPLFASGPINIPSPYVPQICAPTFLSPSLPASALIEAKDRLSSQVKKLKEVLHLQKEFAQLSTELASLQASFKETLLVPPTTSFLPPVPIKAPATVKTKNPQGPQSKT